ncbi:MAG TPA: PIG-L family deacetylase [Caulobacteraceae bacterium]
MAALPFGSSILLLCPHPDDEVVGFAAAIGRAQAAGARVAAVFLTHGCVDQATMWPWARARYGEAVARRRAEAERAAAALGLAVAGWSERPARHLWRELAAAEAEVRAAASAVAADQLWVTAFEGGNPDHDGANAIAARLAAEGTSVLEFAEYNLAGGRPRSHRFPAPNGSETVLELTAAERAAKARLLALYASEKGNLGYVAANQEALRPLASYDYARPPHPGKLWYARFQWTPFRHPMVDFTRPSDVAAAISAYLAAPAASR